MDNLLRRLRFNLMYFGRPPWDTGIPPPELLAFIRKHPPGRAIDLGCGTGTNLLALAQAGWQVTGVDFVGRAVRSARRRLRQVGLPGEVRAGDVTRLESVQGLYDLVLDIGCFHGLPEAGREAYRRNLSAIIAPGGHFLLYAHWKRNPDTPIGITEQDFRAFQSLLTLNWREDSLDRWERPTGWMQFVRLENHPAASQAG